MLKPKHLGLLLAAAALVLAVFTGTAYASLSIEEPVEEKDLGTEIIPLEEPRVIADKYPASVTGDRFKIGEIVGKLDVFKRTGTSVKTYCENVTVSGGTITGPVTELKLTPEYSKCESTNVEGKPVGTGATVAMHSCKYVLSDLSPLENTFSPITAAIACNKGDSISVTLTPGCEVTIPPQDLSGTSGLFNAAKEGKKLLGSEVLGSGVTYTVNNELTCKLLGFPGKGTYTDGAVESDFEFLGLSIEEPVEEKDLGTEIIPLEEPRIIADKYPASVTGERFKIGEIVGKLDVFKHTGTSMRTYCENVSVSGGTITGPVTELKLTPEYSKCESTNVGGEATVAMHSCKYVLSDFSPLEITFSPVTAKIECNKGDSISITFTPGCEVTIPPQELSGTSGLFNVGKEGKKLVGSEVLGSGITYTVNNDFICKFLGFPGKGTYTDGAVESDFLLGS